MQTGLTHRKDTFEGHMEMSHIETEKYLGQTVSSNGRNTTNIKKMKKKGIGIQNKIIQILDNMPGGKFHFMIAKILRSSYLI